MSHEGVAGLVIGSDLLLTGTDQATTAGRSGENTVYSLLEVHISDHLASGPGGEDCRFVQEVLQIRPTEPWCLPGQAIQINIRRQRFIARVDPNDRTPPVDIGCIQYNPSVEPA